MQAALGATTGVPTISAKQHARSMPTKNPKDGLGSVHVQYNAQRNAECCGPIFWNSLILSDVGAKLFFWATLVCACERMMCMRRTQSILVILNLDISNYCTYRTMWASPWKSLLKDSTVVHVYRTLVQCATPHSIYRTLHSKFPCQCASPDGAPVLAF